MTPDGDGPAAAGRIVDMHDSGRRVGEECVECLPEVCAGNDRSLNHHRLFVECAHGQLTRSQLIGPVRRVVCERIMRDEDHPLADLCVAQASAAGSRSRDGLAGADVGTVGRGPAGVIAPRIKRTATHRRAVRERLFIGGIDS